MIIRKHFSIFKISRNILILLILMLGWGSAWVVSADEEGGPDRTYTKTIEVMEYTWWVAQWSDNEVLCELNIDHEGLPTGGEIYADCGEDVFEKWKETMPCEEASIGGDTSTCNGVYLHYVRSQIVEREVIEDLPAPQVWISISGCRPFLYGYRCQGTPFLELVAEEPLPFEHITAVHAEMAGEEYSCVSEICHIPLVDEFAEGTTVEFWADSSYGDESPTFSACRCPQYTVGWGTASGLFFDLGRLCPHGGASPLAANTRQSR
jgi:hypothetical protein